MFYKKPLKIVIDSIADESFRLSVAFETRKGFWSSRFMEFPAYPGEKEINMVIKHGQSHEHTGAISKFGQITFQGKSVGAFEKSY